MLKGWPRRIRTFLFGVEALGPSNGRGGLAQANGFACVAQANGFACVAEGTVVETDTHTGAPRLAGGTCDPARLPSIIGTSSR